MDKEPNIKIRLHARKKHGGRLKAEELIDELDWRVRELFAPKIATSVNRVINAIAHEESQDGSYWYDEDNLFNALQAAINFLSFDEINSIVGFITGLAERLDCTD